MEEKKKERWRRRRKKRKVEEGLSGCGKWRGAINFRHVHSLKAQKTLAHMFGKS